MTIWMFIAYRRERDRKKKKSLTRPLITSTIVEIKLKSICDV